MSWHWMKPSTSRITINENSCAVKAVAADHHFALTGTPIENRLSELWSIFDFLMPGLLGSYKRFMSIWERPSPMPGLQDGSIG